MVKNIQDLKQTGKLPVTKQNSLSFYQFKCLFNNSLVAVPRFVSSSAVSMIGQAPQVWWGSCCGQNSLNLRNFTSFNLLLIQKFNYSFGYWEKQTNTQKHKLTRKYLSSLCSTWSSYFHIFASLVFISHCTCPSPILLAMWKGGVSEQCFLSAGLFFFPISMHGSLMTVVPWW